MTSPLLSASPAELEALSAHRDPVVRRLARREAYLRHIAWEARISR